MQGHGLAIINGFGRSLGDSLIGLQALRVAQTLAGMPIPLLVRRHYGRPLVDQLYTFAADFAEVQIVADNEADDAPAGFANVIDMRDFAFSPDFRGMAMIDFFLGRLGLDAHAIPSSEKRNQWLAPRIRPRRPAGLPDRYVLVCPSSSLPLRDMPPCVHAAIVERLLANGARVVTQGASPLTGVMALPAFTQIEDLCGLVAGAQAIVSTDTAMVHLADAFDVPCIAVFTTHRPEWRVRDYPACTAIHLPVAGIPDALEFARNDSDIACAVRTWQAGLPKILNALEAVGATATAASPRRD
jgi:hypothetical protein